MEVLLQGLPPVIAPDTRLVVLGSFPGVASLRARQYYGHLRNHFWPILSALWSVDLRSLPFAERLDVVRAQGDDGRGDGLGALRRQRQEVTDGSATRAQLEPRRQRGQVRDARRELRLGQSSAAVDNEH